MTRDGALAHLETYLEQVERRLHVLPAEEVAEILKELRSHVLDRVEGVLTPRTVEAALEALGSPTEIARANVTERAAAAVDASSAPLKVLRALYRVATVSVLGLFTFLVSLFGYSLALGFLAVAVLKPIIPEHVGVWQTVTGDGTYDYSVGAVVMSAHSRELVGWWIIPISLALAVGLGYVTWRLGSWAVRLMGRGARRRRRSEVEFAAPLV